MEPNRPTLKEALDDIETRFLYNLPKSELEQPDRLFFQIEQCWWWYEDFKADVYPHLPHFKRFETFAAKLFEHSALLAKVGDKFQQLLVGFQKYKSKVPVCGCILLNPEMNKMVLAKVHKSDIWSFPRGKINENEPESACAVREVFEETGYDASHLVIEKDYLMDVMGEKPIKLFIICNVPESTEFEPQTRKEVDDVQFHPLDSLPRTYGVLNFMKSLLPWIHRKRRHNAKALKSPPLVPMSVKVAAAAQTVTAIKQRSSSVVPKTNSGGAATILATMQQSAANGKGGDRRNITPTGNASKNVVSAAKSPLLVAAGGNRSLSTGKNKGKDVRHASANPSPGTVKRLSNLFDLRNNDTFDTAGGSTKRWGVNDMFAANAKLTGKNYTYDGNPHQFGASHPRFVNYNELANATSSRSLIEGSGTGIAGGNNGSGGVDTSSEAFKKSTATFLFNIPIRYASTGTTVSSANVSNSSSAKITTGAGSAKGGGASDADDEDSDENNPFRAWSEQSVRNHQRLRAGITGDEEDEEAMAFSLPNKQHKEEGAGKKAKKNSRKVADVVPMTPPLHPKGNGKNSNSSNIASDTETSAANSPLREFSLPRSSFQFPVTGIKGSSSSSSSAQHRHDSFDSTVVDENEYRYSNGHALAGFDFTAPVGTSNDGAAELKQLLAEFESGRKCVFPVNFKLNKAAIMKNFDQAFLRGSA